MKRSAAVLVGTLVLPTSIHAEAGNEELYGTWRLVSYTQTILATGEATEIFGKTPRGFVNYGRDGRMMVLIVKDERPKPPDLAKMTDQERAQLFKTLVAYGGTYTLDAKTITHHLDISWNEIWTGTDQVRNIKFDGRKVILSTNPQPRSQDGPAREDLSNQRSRVWRALYVGPGNLWAILSTTILPKEADLRLYPEKEEMAMAFKFSESNALQEIVYRFYAGNWRAWEILYRQK